MSQDIKITADIIDYLGKYEDGVLVLLSISYNNTFTEGTLYYTNQMLAITVDESVEKQLGSPIELWSGYKELLISILKRVVPYDEIINRLDEFDFTRYVKQPDSAESGEEIDEDDIRLAE